jgi:hypothetical protein
MKGAADAAPFYLSAYSIGLLPDHRCGQPCLVNGRVLATLGAAAMHTQSAAG